MGLYPKKFLQVIEMFYLGIDIGKNFHVASLLDERKILELSNLSRFRFSLVRQTICVLDKLFPEYQSVFSDVFGKTSKEILSLFSSPADFEDIATDKLKLLLERVSLKAFAKKKLNELSRKAKNSFGISFGLESLKFQLQSLLAHISFIEEQVSPFIEEQVSQIDSKIAELLEEFKSTITTIPGIGNVIGTKNSPYEIQSLS